MLPRVSCISHSPHFFRLEFLGDAILDFVVTQRIYRDHPNMDPGQLTDLRTALVSNVNLAVITVRLGIHKYLDYVDQNLSDYIRSFSDAVSNREINNIWQLEVRALGWIFCFILG